MEEVEQLCNRIAILDKGKVIALGTKEAAAIVENVKNKIAEYHKNGDEINLNSTQAMLDE